MCLRLPTVPSPFSLRTLLRRRNTLIRKIGAKEMRMRQSKKRAKTGLFMPCTCAHRLSSYPTMNISTICLHQLFIAKDFRLMIFVELCISSSTSKSVQISSSAFFIGQFFSVDCISNWLAFLSSVRLKVASFAFLSRLNRINQTFFSFLTSQTSSCF